MGQNGGVRSNIEKVPRGIRGEKSSKDKILPDYDFDRPKSVRNCCLIELFCDVVCVVTLAF